MCAATWAVIEGWLLKKLIKKCTWKNFISYIYAISFILVDKFLCYMLKKFISRKSFI